MQPSALSARSKDRALSAADEARSLSRRHVPSFETVDIGVLRSCLHWEFADCVGEAPSREDPAVFSTHLCAPLSWSSCWCKPSPDPFLTPALRCLMLPPLSTCSQAPLPPLRSGTPPDASSSEDDEADDPEIMNGEDGDGASSHGEEEVAAGREKMNGDDSSSCIGEGLDALGMELQGPGDEDEEEEGIPPSAAASGSVDDAEAHNGGNGGEAPLPRQQRAATSLRERASSVLHAASPRGPPESAAGSVKPRPTCSVTFERVLEDLVVLTFFAGGEGGEGRKGWRG